MPIEPLPENTIRLLGSASTITTPVGLVKELLENAIDAGATSIDILVSQNTIDGIEIRDNGTGIHPDDYDCLGRPGHTSKLRSFDELPKIGAITLGFRGQALASANSLGKVTVTTMTSQDSVAVRLKLRQGVGGVETQEPTSAPVGTSVSVTALFSRLPVREQVILKKAQKSIVNIKHLLYAYALARPHIRLSFKVIGRGPKQSWSYSPRPDASVKEAVVQVFGTGVMSQCIWRKLITETSLEDDASHDGPDLVIEAVLPKPQADLSKLSKGSFISIDSRPITTLRGIGRNLVSAFRKQFRKSWGVDDGLNLNDVFIRVNVKCSPGTYDPNVEPSKDHVLFANESQVTNLFGRLCTEVYKIQEVPSAFVTIEKRPLIRGTQTRTPPPSSDGPEGGDGLRALHPEDEACGITINSPESPMSSLLSPLHSHLLEMSAEPAQELPRNKILRYSPCPRNEIQSALSIVMSSGSAFQGRSGTWQAQPIQPPIRDASGGDAILNHSQIEVQDIQDGHMVPPHRESTPFQATAPFNQTRKKGFQVNISADPDMSSDEEADILASRFRELRGMNSQLDESHEGPKECLNPWVIARMTAPTRQLIADNGVSTEASQSLDDRQEPTTLSGVSEALEEEIPVLRPLGGPPGDLDMPRTERLCIPHMDRRGVQADLHHNQPASLGNSREYPDLADGEMPWSPSQAAKSNGMRALPDLRADCNDASFPDGFVQTQLSFGGPRMKQKKSNKRMQMHINDVLEEPNPPFRRPRGLNARGRHSPTGGDIRTSGPHGDDPTDHRQYNEHSGGINRDRTLIQFSQSPRSSPIRSRESRLAQQPLAPKPNTGHIENRHIDEDPREGSMTRQCSIWEHLGQAHGEIKRTKSDRLPLETIPEGYEVQHLVLVVESDTENFGRSQEWDTEDVILDSESMFFSVDLEEVAEIEGRLKQVLSAWAKKTLGEETEVDINLRKVVKGKGVATEHGC